MLSLLKDWKGDIEINDKVYTAEELSKIACDSFSDSMHIKLYAKHKNAVQSVLDASESKLEEYQITVKKYMTQKASPSFDFMAKWNNDIPMPMRTMTGTIEKETKGMVYMKLHGLGKPTITCMCCGKELTNPISRYYGIGPICLSKIGISRDIDDIENIKEDLVNITWEGWIIRSAIIEKEKV